MNMFEIYSEYFTQDDTSQISEPDWEFTFFNFLTEELKEKLFKQIKEMTWNQKYFYQGLQYEFGIRVDKNFKKALEYYFKGFYMRNPYCCYRLYFIYRTENQNFQTRRNKDLAILLLLISAAYCEFMPINHKFEAKLHFAINLDLEDYEKTKIFAILDSLKYSPITDSEVIFLRSWLNIFFNKNLEELAETLLLLTNAVENCPFEQSIFLLANFYFDPFETSIERSLDKANFYFSKLENSSDPVILFGLGKFYSNFNQYEKALNFMWKSLTTGFNAYNGFVNVKLCFLNKINFEEYKLVLKFMLRNLILGDCNVLADLIAFLKYVKMIGKRKEKLLESELNQNCSGIAGMNSIDFDCINREKNLNKNNNFKNDNELKIELNDETSINTQSKRISLINEIAFIKKIHEKYAFYFYSFIHFNEDFLKLNKSLSLNYLINLPYFLINSYTKGSYKGVMNLEKVNSIATNEELQSKVNDRHKNYLLMLAAKNTNKKKEVQKYFAKYKEFTKETYESNYLQCYTLFEFEFYLKNIKSAHNYLEIINSKNSLNSELSYSNFETFHIQEKAKILLENEDFGLDDPKGLSENNRSVTKNSAAEGKSSCIICMDNPKVTIFVPCGHKCCCEKCAEIIYSQKKQCPICMIKIEYKISKVYD